MKLLAEISDATLGIGPAALPEAHYKVRKSARALLCKDDGTIAVQYLKRDGFHKLPGGGVDGIETIHEALMREIREEVGCECKIEKDVGLVIEYRTEHQLVHLAFCFVAKVVGAIGIPILEQAEIDEQMETIWMRPEDAHALIAQERPEQYNGKFINVRERTFLEEFLNTK